MRKVSKSNAYGSTPFHFTTFDAVEKGYFSKKYSLILDLDSGIWINTFSFYYFDAVEKGYLSKKYLLLQIKIPDLSFSDL